MVGRRAAAKQHESAYLRQVRDATLNPGATFPPIMAAGSGGRSSFIVRRAAALPPSARNAAALSQAASTHAAIGQTTRRLVREAGRDP
eukprot:SAG11_NODE_3655_length_2306_cov_1.716357_3_plen_88_part_00